MSPAVLDGPGGKKTVACREIGGGVPADTIMATPWSTGTGSGSDAMRDTARSRPWDVTKGGGHSIVTTASTGLTWPAGMTDCMLIENVGTLAGVRCAQSLPTWNVGEWRYHRVFFACVAPDSSGGDSRHPWQDGTGGSATNWEFNVQILTNGTWFPFWQNYGNDVKYPGGGVQTARWVLTDGGGLSGTPPHDVVLDKDVVYCFEYAAQRLSSTTLTQRSRVRDVSGTLLYDSSNWTRQNEDGDTLDEGHVFAINNADYLENLNLGVNGNNTPPSPYNQFFWGAYLLRTDDWVGGVFDPAEESF